MKKIIILFCVATITMLGCKKSDNQIINTISDKKILIKVDAEHIDGEVVSSPIVVVY